ncbi:MAG: ABC transporter ATP-binding protein [Bacillota bacterium]|nr:ABC transporter ATP-binding protein [Bacillota bacterium]
MHIEENKLPDYEELFEETRTKKHVAARVVYNLFLQNKFDFIISILLYFVKSVAIWVIPIVLAGAINIATNHVMGKGGDVKDIWMWAIVGLIVLVINIPFNALYVHFSSRALRNIGAGMRNSLVKKLQHLSITYHKEIESGRLQSKFIRDMEAIEFLNNQMIMTLVPAIITASVTMLIVIYKNWLMACLFVAIIPINLVIVRSFRNKIRKNNRDFRHEVENVSSKVSDMIEMIPLTKAHGLEEEQIQRLNESLINLKNTGLRMDKTGGYFSSINWVSYNVIINLFVIVAAIMAYYRKIEIGDIVMYQTYFNMVMNHINLIINMYQEMIKGVESLKSVTEIMVSDDIEDNRDKIKLRYVHGTVQFDNVSYHYPNDEKTIIKDFTLNVKSGECIAFVGASGCGKSTIMNMIIGFLKPVKGVLKIDGKEINLLNLEDYRKFIAVVPQNSILFTGTIRENILYGVKNVNEKKMQEIMDKANIREFVDKMPNGLDTFIGEHGGKLSGGQKQRISIARALIRDPKIIILDEATSALDNISEYQVQQAMGSLIKDRTTFIVAHRLSTIRDANRIVVMDEGRIVEMGTYEELMENRGEFYKLKNLSDMNTEGVEV